MPKSNNNLPNLCYELADLNHMYRSGLKQFCFEDFETIASHLHRVAAIAYILAKVTRANVEKILLMALFHDSAETRTGDTNWTQKPYVNQNEEQAIKDQWANLPSGIGTDIIKLLKEYHERKSLESKIVKDADFISFFITMKQLAWKGNKEAQYRLETELKNMDYMYTKQGKDLLQEVMKTEPNDWTRALHKRTMKIYSIKGDKKR